MSTEPPTTLTVRVACACAGRRHPIRLTAYVVDDLLLLGRPPSYPIGNFRCMKCGVTVWITLGDVQRLNAA